MKEKENKKGKLGKSRFVLTINFLIFFISSLVNFALFTLCYTKFLEAGLRSMQKWNYNITGGIKDIKTA